MKTPARLTVTAAYLLLFCGNSAYGSDMPPMPSSYLQAVILLLIYGLPYSLILYPALILVPVYLSRKLIISFFSQDPNAGGWRHARKLRIATLVSLVPWGLLGLWIVYDMATNKSF